MAKISNILALDVGSRRVGLSFVADGLSVPRQLDTIEADSHLTEKLKNVCKKYKIEKIVVGLPRSLDGNETDQTRSIKEFAAGLKRRLKMPVVFQDEALTSNQASNILSRRGHLIDKGEVDAVAASIILDDYLKSSGAVR